MSKHANKLSNLLKGVGIGSVPKLDSSCCHLEDVLVIGNHPLLSRSLDEIVGVVHKLNSVRIVSPIKCYVIWYPITVK